MRLKIVINIFLLIYFIGCASQGSLYRETYEINTIEAFKDFLKKYPEGIYAEAAKERIRDIRYNKTREKNTIMAYEEFLKVYPNTKYSRETLSKIEELKYLNAINSNNIDSIIEYLKQNPEGNFIEQSRAYIIQLLNPTSHENVLSVISLNDILYYLRKYPQSNNLKNILGFVENQNLGKSYKEKHSIFKIESIETFEELNTTEYIFYKENVKPISKKIKPNSGQIFYKTVVTIYNYGKPIELYHGNIIIFSKSFSANPFMCDKHSYDDSRFIKNDSDPSLIKKHTKLFLTFEVPINEVDNLKLSIK